MQPRIRRSLYAILATCALAGSPTLLAQQQAGQAQPGQAQARQAQASQQQNQARQAGKASIAQVQKVIQDWKEMPRKVAQDVMRKYGPPDEVTEYRLVWHNNGPWKRTELINEEIDHQFPLPHKDMLHQVVAFEVPTDKVDEILAFDGSVIVDRTRGELGARCDKEHANFLAVNLAREIATGQRSVEDARRIYAEQIVAMARGEPAPLTTGLDFQPPASAGDPGQQVIPESVARQVKDNLKQMGAAR